MTPVAATVLTVTSAPVHVPPDLLLVLPSMTRSLDSRTPVAIPIGCPATFVHYPLKSSRIAGTQNVATSTPLPRDPPWSTSVHWEVPGISHAFSSGSQPASGLSTIPRCDPRTWSPRHLLPLCRSCASPARLPNCIRLPRLCRPICSTSEHGTGYCFPGTLVSDIPFPE